MNLCWLIQVIRASEVPPSWGAAGAEAWSTVSGPETGTGNLWPSPNSMQVRTRWQKIGDPIEVIRTFMPETPTRTTRRREVRPDSSSAGRTLITTRSSRPSPSTTRAPTRSITWPRLECKRGLDLRSLKLFPKRICRWPWTCKSRF